MARRPNLILAGGRLLIIIFCSVIITTGILQSCKKEVGGHDFPPTGRTVYLIAITWGLVSSTSIDTLSTGILHNYRGSTGDSLNVGYNVIPGLKVSDLNTDIEGVSTSVPIDTLFQCGLVSGGDTSTIAYDTLITATPWRPSYSDTLFITKLSPSAFVFKVRYADIGGEGVEMDTFRFIRNH